jgi:hypothetical protein
MEKGSNQEDNNKTDVVGHSLSNPVPIDIVESWLKGEYLVGRSDSIGYDYIGWSLMIRGMYVYVVISDLKDNDVSELRRNVLHRSKSHIFPFGENDDRIVSLAGICTIDIKDGDLVYQGVRLYTNEELYAKAKGGKTKKATPVKTRPLFWRSMFSKLTRVNKDSDPHVYLGSVLYEPEKDLAYEGIQRDLRNEIETDWMKDAEDKVWLNMLLGYWPKTYRRFAKDFAWKKPDKKGLARFREQAAKYLDRRLDEDLIAVVNGAAKDKADDVSALIHMDLKLWRKKKREGEFQTATLNDKLFPKNAGTIYYFPLEA